MTETPGERKKRFRFWITLSELVGVLALVIAGLNSWDAHREHAAASRREAVADRAASAARSAVVLEGEMEADGGRLSLRTVNPAQVVQSQRYLFPPGRARPRHGGQRCAPADRPGLDRRRRALRCRPRPQGRRGGRRRRRLPARRRVHHLRRGWRDAHRRVSVPAGLRLAWAAVRRPEAGAAGRFADPPCGPGRPQGRGGGRLATRPSRFGFTWNSNAPDRLVLSSSSP